MPALRAGAAVPAGAAGIPSVVAAVPPRGPYPSSSSRRTQRAREIQRNIIILYQRVRETGRRPPLEGGGAESPIQGILRRQSLGAPHSSSTLHSKL